MHTDLKTKNHGTHGIHGKNHSPCIPCVPWLRDFITYGNACLAVLPEEPGKGGWRQMRGRTNRLLCVFVVALALALVASCARVPYYYTYGKETSDTLRLKPDEPQIARGAPVPFLDGLGHYVFSLPSKLLLWNWKVDNHNISPETEKAVAAYLKANDLKRVKIRLNQYEPRDEWRRLVRNSAMPGFWRYTFGLLTCAEYMIFPGRLFGGDCYNPYTNSVSIYSDHKAIALHECAHAKDFAGRSRQMKGWYSFFRILPIVPLYQEGIATGDAIGYVKDLKDYQLEESSYKILYPAYCTYIAGEGLRWVRVQWWVSYAVTYAAALPGHIAGRIKAARVDEPLENY
jgi:hypothetical protein